jgi:hypothetical protein
MGQHEKLLSDENFRSQRNEDSKAHRKAEKVAQVQLNDRVEAQEVAINKYKQSLAHTTAINNALELENAKLKGQLLEQFHFTFPTCCKIGKLAFLQPQGDRTASLACQYSSLMHSSPYASHRFHGSINGETRDCMKVNYHQVFQIDTS